jgi:hypothetical protein
MKRQIVNGEQLRSKELEEQQEQRLEENEHVRQRAEALVRKIGEACDELERLAEENPELVGRVTYGAEEHKEAYLRLKARLSLADAAPRCRWIRQDGTTCGSPQMKRHIYCFAHRQMAEAQALALRLPAAEDANAIQIGIMRIQKALIEGTISTKMAGLLLYSMQLAMTNVGRTTFAQVKSEEPVTETVDAAEALREKQTPITETLRHGGSAGQENETLPLMNADDFDSGRVDEEFVPMAGGYGYTRVRLKIEPERQPAEAAMASGDRSQVHAKLG